MRVTFSTSFRDASTEITRAAERLATAEKQVSSGRRIDRASEDPAGAARAISDHAAIGTLDGYTGAADAATSRLTVADSTLSDIIDKIIFAQSSLAGARGSVTQKQRDAAATDLQGVAEALFSDFNAQFRGAFLFAGTVAAAPYTQAAGVVSTYQGNTSVMSIDIADGRSVPVSIDGSAVAQGSDTTDLFTALSAVITAVKAGDETGMGQGLDALGRALDRATLAQTRVGAGLRTLDDTRAELGQTKLDAGARLSKNENVDLAAAIAQMTESDTAYRAALAAFGKMGTVSLMDYLR